MQEMNVEGITSFLGGVSVSLFVQAADNRRRPLKKRNSYFLHILLFPCVQHMSAATCIDDLIILLFSHSNTLHLSKNGRTSSDGSVNI